MNRDIHGSRGPFNPLISRFVLLVLLVVVIMVVEDDHDHEHELAHHRRSRSCQMSMCLAFVVARLDTVIIPSNI